MRRLLNCLRDKRGATSIEYALVAALIALGLTASMRTVGGNVKLLFGTVANGLAGGDEGSAPPPSATNAMGVGR